MCRTASIAAVLAVACLIAPATTAAQRRQVKFGIGGGVAMPSGDYHEDASGEGFDMGWQGIAFLEFHSPRRPLGMRLDVLIGETPANDVLSADIAPVTAKMRMRGGNLDLIFNFPPSKRGGGLYALGGVGYYRATISASSAGIVADTSEDKFAWNAGGGLTVPVGRAKMFVEVRYIHVDTAFDVSSLPFISATAGFRLGGK